MSKTRWAIFYAVIIFVDIVQVLLDLVAIGVVLNRVIDVVVAFLLPFFLHISGVKMTDMKKILSIFAAFGFELMPGVDALPLWTLDLFVIHSISKGEEKLKKTMPTVLEGVRRIAKTGEGLNNQAREYLVKDGVRRPYGRDTI